VCIRKTRKFMNALGRTSDRVLRRGAFLGRMSGASSSKVSFASYSGR
jgi:hypothetical protein